MSNANERAIARLSIVAFAIDALVITLLVVAAHQIIQRFIFPPRDWMFIAAVPVALLLHFLAVELLARGMSVGRLCSGLKVVDKETGAAPRMFRRAKRCASVLTTLGVRSLNPNTLPNYNKHPANCMCSDWAGSAVTVSRPVSRKPAPEVYDGASSLAQPAARRADIAGGAAHLMVATGPHAGQVMALSQGKHFKSKGLFVIGRHPTSTDLVLSGDAKVSGIHCRIGAQNDKFVIIDGKSKAAPSRNGTRVNNKSVGSAGSTALKPGDVIGVGDTTLKFVLR